MHISCTQRPSRMNLNEDNGHAGGGLDGVSNGEGGLETIQEDQEPDNDQQTIEVCDLYIHVLVCVVFYGPVITIYKTHLTDIRHTVRHNTQQYVYSNCPLSVSQAMTPIVRPSNVCGFQTNNFVHRV